jgi:hypothetical protein
MFAGQGPTQHTQVTVPAGRRWVVRDVVAEGSVASGVGVSIGGVGFVCLLDLVAVAGAHYGHWEGRVVAYAGEILDVFAGDPSVFVIVTGYEFLDG